MNDYEIRYNIDSQFETRSEGSRHVVAGYAAVFNTRSQNLGGFVEQVLPGTFRKTIAESDVRALWNHNADYVLGRNKAETLRMSEDNTGLHYEVDLPDTQLARDLRESIARGDITQSSFGFATIEDDWGFTGDDFPLRSLKEVKLFDVSPVTYPAYTDATIGTRALERLAGVKGLELTEVRQNLANVINDEKSAPVSATYVVRRYIEPASIIAIRGRLK
ncbi:MAG: HK97 family phage prohead protease [Chitinophagaceae bacterium]